MCSRAADCFRISASPAISASRQNCWARRLWRFPRGSTNCSTWCGSIARSTAIAFPMSSRAASASASASRGRWRRSRRIVLMDEPFGALDPLTRDALGDDYRALHDKLGLTTVMITHDMTEAILLADRVAVMRAGRLVGAGHAGGACRQRRRLCRRTPAHAAAAGGAAQGAAAAGWRGMRFFQRSALERGAGASAGLSRQSCARQRRGAGARTSGQPAACDRRAQPSADARRAARARLDRADGAGAGAARPVLSAAARARLIDAGVVRLWLFGVRIPARGAGAGALFDAAGAAQHHHRPARRRCRDPRGRAGRRHDAAAVVVHGRAAAGAAGDHGGHPHLGGLGDRHRDIVDADRPDQPRQLHLCRAANAELGVRAVRLPRRRGAGARGRSIAGVDRDRHSQPQPRARGARRRRHRGAGRGNAGALDGARAIELCRRRQDLCRAICAVGADRAAAAGGGTFRRARARASAPT